MPTLSTLLTGLAERLTDFENYDTQDGKLWHVMITAVYTLTVGPAHKASLVQKIFVLNFITSYLGIFLTAFVYVPFGKILVPYLDVFQITAQKFTTEGKALPTKQWEINPDRLRKQIIYFTVTAQVVSFVTEVVVPHVKRRLSKTVEKVSELSEKNGYQIKDVPEEREFLHRVRNEAELDQYDVTVDYREMVIQFGTPRPVPSRFATVASYGV